MNMQSSRLRKSRVAIFWDWQNSRATEAQIQCLLVFAYLNGIIAWKRVYSDWQLETDRQLSEKLWCEGFELISIPSYKNKPNRTDHKLIQDCRKQTIGQSDITTVILLTGDGDYKTLVQDLKSHGKKILVIARCQNTTNRKLIEVADKFYFFNQIEQWFENLKLAA